MSEIKIEYRNVDELIPYENNPRLNDHAIQSVADSIDKFGFKVPIVIDKHGEIITGHTRLKASKKLGLDKVPVIVADDLSDDQVKAFRLVDNKVGELSDWDMELLNAELANIEIDLSDQFGLLDLLQDDENHADIDVRLDKEEHHRENTVNQYNLDLYDKWRVDGKYQMPSLLPVDHVPYKLIGFNYVLNKPDYCAGVHFYLDDYQFERIWQRPEYYIEKLLGFDCVLTPDFSLYTDMPLVMQAWNVYRSRLIGQAMQDYGITVIPTVSWCHEDSFEFAFDGIPKHSTVSISTIGVKRDKDALAIWEKGVNEMIRRLEPIKIIVYGGQLDFDFGDIEVFYIENTNTEKFKRGD